MTTFDLPDVGRLRQVRDDDLSRMLQWRNAPNVRQNMYSQDEIALADHLAWWERIKASERDAYFIFEHSGTPLGVVSFNEIDRKNRSAFWGIYAKPDAPKGTGSRMQTLLFEYGFNVLELHKLNCEVLEANSIALGLYRKFGCEEEGFLHDHRLVGSEFINVHRLAMRATRWAQMRSTHLPSPSQEA